MIYNIWLSELHHPQNRKKEWLLIHKTAENVHKAMSESGFLFQSELSLDNAKRIMDSCEKSNVHVHLLSEFGVPDYGELPTLLYCKGIFRKTAGSVGIVGARRCTSYGKRMTEELAAECARQNIAVISGMAKGVDAIAHTSALKNGGYTIAALGNGPDICFPSEHRSLYEKICENGLVISEYTPGTHATKFTFPMRNRLIAAFSDKLAVTEAGAKSGALITCERAKYYGKPVYAFPGPIDSPESEGCNNLIYTGAARLYKKSDLFTEATQLSIPGVYSPDSDSFSKSASGLPAQVLEYLSSHHKHADFDQLAHALSLESGQVYTLITEMELDDLVKTEGENIWLL